MMKLHDALHAMPWWLQTIGVVVLLLAAANDEFLTDKDWGQRPSMVLAVDTAGSWLALVVLVFLVVAYYWPK